MLNLEGADLQFSHLAHLMCFNTSDEDDSWILSLYKQFEHTSSSKKSASK